MKYPIPACVGDLNGDSGYIYPPARSLNLTSFYCEWERTAQTNMNKTIAFTLLNGTIGFTARPRCYYKWNSVWFSASEFDENPDSLVVAYYVGGGMKQD